MKSVSLIFFLLLITSDGLTQTALPLVYEIKSDTAFEQFINTQYLEVSEDKSGVGR